MSVRHIRTFVVAIALLLGSWWLPDAGAQGRGRGRGQSEITGTVEMVVVDAPDERVARPHRVADRLRVEVTAEREMASAGSEVEVDDEVGTARPGAEL